MRVGSRRLRAIAGAGSPRAPRRRAARDRLAAHRVPDSPPLGTARARTRARITARRRAQRAARRARRRAPAARRRAASVVTTIATPTPRAACRAGASRRGRPAARGHSSLKPPRPSGGGAALAGRGRVDDHPARPLLEHRLERAAEERPPVRGAAAAASRSRARWISRASSTIRAAGLPGAHLLPVARDPPAAEHARGVDRRLRALLLLGHVGGDRRGRGHGDRDQHVDAPPAPRRELGGGGHGLALSRRRPRRRPAPTRTRPRARRPALGRRP